MKVRPILFGGDMIRALLDGRKTMTRRIVKPQHFREDHSEDASGQCIGAGWWPKLRLCPYGQKGDLLWVRETWADTNGESGPMISYRAGGDRFLIDDSYPVDYSRYPGANFTMWCGDLRRGEPDHSWRPSIHMPRWASRLTLRITDVRVERLQEISEEDARAEGAEPVLVPPDGGSCPHVQGFIELWDSINGPESWDEDPWVWVIAFDVIRQNVNTMLGEREGK